MFCTRCFYHSLAGVASYKRYIDVIVKDHCKLRHECSFGSYESKGQDHSEFHRVFHSISCWIRVSKAVSPTLSSRCQG